MTYTQLELDSQAGQIAYQEAPAYNNIEPVSLAGQIAYQEAPAYNRIIEYDDYELAKIKAMIIRFAFAGLAYTFDGNKFEQFPSQETPVIFPVVASNRMLVMACGMTEDGKVSGDVLTYGNVKEIIENNSDRDWIALVSSNKGQSVYLVDDVGNTIRKVQPSETVLLKPKYKLASDKPFKIYIIEVR